MLSELASFPGLRRAITTSAHLGELLLVDLLDRVVVGYRRGIEGFRFRPVCKVGIGKRRADTSVDKVTTLIFSAMTCVGIVVGSAAHRATGLQNGR